MTDAPSIDPAALSVIGETPTVLRALLAGLPGEVLREPNDEGWSLKDIVAHLYDVEGAAFGDRIQRMLTEDRPFIGSIDPPARLAAGGYASRELGELLDELQARRAENLSWLRGLTAQDLSRVGQHDEVGEISVLDIIHQWPAHDLSHLRQVALMLQAHFAPLMGGTRAFYDV
jgi:DinB superfamily